MKLNIIMGIFKNNGDIDIQKGTERWHSRYIGTGDETRDLIMEVDMKQEI